MKSCGSWLCDMGYVVIANHPIGGIMFYGPIGSGNFRKSLFYLTADHIPHVFSSEEEASSWQKTSYWKDVNIDTWDVQIITIEEFEVMRVMMS